ASTLPPSDGTHHEWMTSVDWMSRITVVFAGAYIVWYEYGSFPEKAALRYWRPWTQIVMLLPLGGVGRVTEADSTTPLALESGGLMIAGRWMNVTTVKATRIRAAATVQPISSRVLPWICAATAPFFARNLRIE